MIGIFILGYAFGAIGALIVLSLMHKKQANGIFQIIEMDGEKPAIAIDFSDRISEDTDTIVLHKKSH